MRRRLLAAVAATVLCASCSAEVVSGHGSALQVRAVPSATPAPGSATPSAATSPATAPATAPGVEPSLALLRRLQGAGSASWVDLTDSSTRTSFALPARTTPTTRLVNGVSQRQYNFALTKQSGVSVSYVRVGSAAAAQASLGLYPTQLQRSFRTLGATDSAVTERSTAAVTGHPAVSFRFAFTPTTPPQIKPVWLVEIVASGADLVLLQTVVFPRTLRYDYLPTARRVQQKLVNSLRLSG